MQTVGRMGRLEPRGGAVRLHVDTADLDLTDAQLGDSIAVSGVCLTAVTLEARDASGTLVAVVSDHATAQDMLRLSRANDVTNTFWFDGMFRRFAANGVDVLKNPPRA